MWCDPTGWNQRFLGSKQAVRCPVWSILSSKSAIWNSTIWATLVFGRACWQCAPSTSDGVNGALKRQQHEKQSSRRPLPRTFTAFCPLTWCCGSVLIQPVRWLFGNTCLCDEMFSLFHPDETQCRSNIADDDLHTVLQIARHKTRTRRRCVNQEEN